MADCKRKTANLFDEVYPNLDYNIRYLPIYVGEGTFTASTTTPRVGTSASLWILQGNVSSGAALANSFYDEQSRTVTADDGYITIAYRITSAAGQSTVNPSDYDVMLNAGETALPYEPYGWLHSLRKLGTATDTLTTLPADLYADGNNATVGLVGNMSQSGTPTSQNPIQPSECGDLETTGVHAGQYKIPISSANTTTPVYLGEMETTRRVKKLVLTGEENKWSQHATLTSWFMLIINTLETNTIVSNVEICSHYKPSTGTPVSIANGEILVNYQEGNKRIIIKDTSYSLLDDFKTYLQQQYTAGTPVTVWYVLAEPTTGIVNEPLRKIGDYADTVSGITIPTITGKDTFDVVTTLKPSEVELTYTGWHDASVKEWNGSEWQ